MSFNVFRFRSVCTECAHAVLLAFMPLAAIAASMPPEFNLSDLDGSNGFVLNGIDAFDASGRSVSNAGDINGDGIDDLIIGADHSGGPDVTGGFPNYFPAGQSYVVFGGSGVGNSGVFNLSALTGSNGFVIKGIDSADFTGRSVSGAGDINGDGVADLVIGAAHADPEDKGSAGESYVVFGGSGVFELSSLTGNNGFVLNGIDVNDRSGISVSGAGEINSDGVDDLIIGANQADTNGNVFAGESYVVFGGGAVGSAGFLNLSSLNGGNGFIIKGVDAGDNSGISVSAADDVNGDGTDDLIIGASAADPNGKFRAGASYVLFGGRNVGSEGALNLSGVNGSNGFVINGIDADDFSGESVSGAGDVNGDGLADLIIGARFADPTVTAVQVKLM